MDKPDEGLHCVNRCFYNENLNLFMHYLVQHVNIKFHSEACRSMFCTAVILHSQFFPSNVYRKCVLSSVIIKYKQKKLPSWLIFFTHRKNDTYVSSSVQPSEIHLWWSLFFGVWFTSSQQNTDMFESILGSLDYFTQTYIYIYVYVFF